MESRTAGSRAGCCHEQLAGPVYAFFMATIRVEIDPLEEAVTEVVVDEASMEQPTLVVGPEGEPVSDARRDHAATIVSRAEWPSWDYGSARFGPGA